MEGREGRRWRRREERRGGGRRGGGGGREEEVEGREGERKEEGGGRLGGVSLVYTPHTMSTDSSVCDMLTAMLFGLR